MEGRIPKPISNPRSFLGSTIGSPYKVLCPNVGRDHYLLRNGYYIEYFNANTFSYSYVILTLI
jgi:hypothetical protein